MSTFRYQALEASGTPVDGVIEADDRKTALQLLSRRGQLESPQQGRLSRQEHDRGRARCEVNDPIAAKHAVAHLHVRPEELESACRIAVRAATGALGHPAKEVLVDVPWIAERDRVDADALSARLCHRPC